MADVIAKEAVKIIASTFDDLVAVNLRKTTEKLLYASMLGVLSYRKQNNGGTRNGIFAYIFQKYRPRQANGLLLGEFTKVY